MRTLLLVLLGFTALTAISGGTILILSPDGRAMHIPPGMLDITPFKTFFLPGIILLLFVGGSSFAAFVQMINKQANGYRFAFAAGVILLGWITGELLLIRAFSWLQLFYYITGFTTLVLTGRLKKIYENSHLQREEL